MPTPHEQAPDGDSDVDGGVERAVDDTAEDPGALSPQGPRTRLAVAIGAGIIAIAYVARYIQVGGILAAVLLAPIVGPSFFLFALVAPDTAMEILDRWGDA